MGKSTINMENHQVSWVYPLQITHFPYSYVTNYQGLPGGIPIDSPVMAASADVSPWTRRFDGLRDTTRPCRLSSNGRR